jgi:hypothetical protein
MGRIMQISDRHLVLGGLEIRYFLGKMTEKRYFDWHTIGDHDDFLRTVAKLGRSLIWSVADDGLGLVFRHDTLEGLVQRKIENWSDPNRRQSKRFKDLADITRLVESHPELWDKLTDDLKSQIDKPE